MVPYQYIQRDSVFLAKSEAKLVVHPVTPESLAESPHAGWARSAGFAAEAGSLLLLPGADGGLAGALFGLGANPDNPLAFGKLARALPAGDWMLGEIPVDPALAMLGFGLGAYRFERYREAKAANVRLAPPAGVDRARIERILAGMVLARDLINVPANDMTPNEMERVFRALAGHHKADVTVIAGDDLIAQNFPLIHAVGRAAAEAPRLMRLDWGQAGDPQVTLVGKGVCFDTGGLDIKPSASMALMKKDMGGAANVMGLAAMIMAAGLKVRLSVIVPVVENSISGNAFRPGDIYTSRAGLTVQIDNTDAEGRLILADALALADDETPGLLIDMATLTGAARVALGPDIPPFFTDDDALAGSIMAASAETLDPLWRLPLYKGYEKDLSARIADLTNAPSGGMAGAITAALFLKRFLRKTRAWAHFDIYGWNPTERPQSLPGGEAQAIHALYRMIETRSGR